jgi:hypothetical protein
MKVSERAWSWQDRKRIPGQTAAELDDAWLQHAATCCSGVWTEATKSQLADI